MRASAGTITAIVIAAITSLASAAQIHLTVHVPAATPADETVFVAGSLDAVGNWKADGLKLTRQADGTYASDLSLNVGDTLDFKFDLGSWDSVEKNADGSERANRSVTIDANTKTIDATVDRWADGKPTTMPSTVVGTLQLITIESKSLGQSRTLRVWLPPGYGDDVNARYDVLYLHDGQNLFDRATSSFGTEWRVDETLTELIAAKKIRPIIVVGIDNGGAARIDEMTYASDPKHGGGHAAAYASFVIDEVLPRINQTYRTQTGPAHTLLGGSSLGGLVSLDIARRHPGVFGGVLAMSPSLWWRGEPIIPAVEHNTGGLKAARVWLDVGTNEEPDEKGVRNVDNVRQMDAALTKQGVAHHVMVEEGAEHNEAAWARRFPEAIRYLLEP